MFSAKLPITNHGMMEYRTLTSIFAAARALLYKVPGGSAMKDRRGFTLIEIMIALAIMALGLVIAIPNLQSWVYRTNAQGFQREVFSELQAARIMASSGTTRYRFRMNLGNEQVSMEMWNGSAWTTASRPPVQTPRGAGIASVTPSGGSPVSTGEYAFVFNPSGAVYGQPDVANDNSIAAIDNAVIILTGTNPQDNASITLFGWTGKARLN
jgi:prepilin-type N-terminal cleavage/methylation domain-containing protein